MIKTTGDDGFGSQDDPGRDYARVAEAIAFLRRYRFERPSLARLADHLGMSPGHTQRLFTRWAGVSPKRFGQLLSVDAVRQAMRETGELLGVAHQAGLSGPGRLHDLLVTLEAVTPGEYRRSGAGLTIRHGLGATPFGTAGVAFTPRGICHLAFVDGAAALPAELASRWPGAELRRDDAAAAELLEQVFALPPGRAGRGLSLWVQGTNFQVQVWRALLRIPFAGVLSYAQLAAAMGRPRAARSVATAIAHNPVAYLIPCHRVLRASGEFGQYHWGAERKQAICAWEAARRQAADEPGSGRR
jgi:AraC family transcriptional regulator of adaptative response/methylated-DNA-[protein]-cysteine methyltransferase